ncbi:MAG: InlB B-repeat-containing protein [Clostridiales bacterium]|nr:InlB B-repeat-containing protein [Clostridiales bacterium]
MRGRTKKIAVALMLVLSMTITALPVQLLSCLTGKSGVVNADGEIQYVELGKDAENTKSSRYLPVYKNQNGFSEQIYTADELDGVTTISALGFKVEEESGLVSFCDIYLLNTEKSSFTDSSDAVLIDDATLVYSGAFFPTKTAWRYFQLNQSFTRETDKNLMVIVINKEESSSSYITEFDTYYSDTTCSLTRYTESQEIKPGDTIGESKTFSYKNKLRLFSSPIPEYTLMYDYNNYSGTASGTTYYAVELDVHIADVTPQYAGHVLVGWNTDRNGNGTHYNAGDPIELTGNMTLYAEWIDADTITYMANDGSDRSSTQECVPAEEVNLKGKIFSRDGFILTGWNTDAEGKGTHYSLGASIELTGDTILYAEWVAMNTITYMANDDTDTSSEQKFDPAEKVKLAGEIFTRDGYIFKGWNTDPESNGTHYNVESTINLTGDTVLYAEWIQMKSITYMANDGSGSSAEQDFDPTKDVVLECEEFSRDGYTLIGWNTESNGSGTVYSLRDVLTLDSDLTLYAMWKNENKSFIVGKIETSATALPIQLYFNYSYSEQIYMAEEIGDCSEIEAIAINLLSDRTASRRGKVYLLDTTLADLAEMNPSDEEGILENAELVFDGTFSFKGAGWSVIPFNQTYHHDTSKNLLVIFIDESGSYVADDFYFSIYQTDFNCTRFYYTDSNYVEPGNIDSSVTEYKNTLKIYTTDGTAFVTLKSNGSDESDVRCVVSNMDTFTLPKNPFTRAGYVFAGWNTQADGLGEAYADSEIISISGDMVLYAQWEAGDHVTYHSNDGSDQTFIEDFNQDTNEVAGNPFFRPHYLFAGWNTQADGQGDSYMPGEEIGRAYSIDLYAQWDYAVYYDFTSEPEDDGWIFIDSDGDGNNWLTNLNTEGIKTHSGDEGAVIYSESYINYQGPLTPDNWAIAPAGVVDPNGTKTVAVWAIGQDKEYYYETFALYAAEVENVDLAEGIDLTKWTQISPVYTSSNVWTEYTGDLSNFSGKNVYVAIRHFDVTDQFRLNIDDVALPFLMPDDKLGENLAGYTVSLDGDIAVNFYMELDQSILNSATAKMVFTVPNGSKTDTQTVTVSEVVDKPVEIDGKTYYIFKCKVAAKDMTGTISAQLVDTDRVGELYTYSVKEYASYILSAEEGKYDAKTIRLVKALLNYGASAQMYFDVNTDNLANADLSDQEKNLSGVTAQLINKPYDPAETDLPDGVSFEGATLSLKSETTLSLYFKSDEKLTFSCGSREVQKSTKDGYQIARIRGINAVDLNTPMELTVTVNGEEYKVTYNPMTYCYNVLQDDSYEPEVQNICRALYLFHQAFMAYLGVQ